MIGARSAARSFQVGLSSMRLAPRRAPPGHAVFQANASRMGMLRNTSNSSGTLIDVPLAFSRPPALPPLIFQDAHSIRAPAGPIHERKIANQPLFPEATTLVAAPRADVLLIDVQLDAVQPLLFEANRQDASNHLGQSSNLAAPRRQRCDTPGWVRRRVTDAREPAPRRGGMCRGAPPTESRIPCWGSSRRACPRPLHRRAGLAGSGAPGSGCAYQAASTTSKKDCFQVFGSDPSRRQVSLSTGSCEMCSARRTGSILIRQ
jgi:hypothetical protein